MAYISPLESLLKGVNRENPHLPITLTPDNVRIQNMEILPSGGLYNTRCVIEPNPDFQGSPHFVGSTSFEYNRLHLARLFASCSVPGQYSDYNTTRDVAAALAERYRVKLSRDDVLLAPVEDLASIVLVARLGSVGFWGMATIPYEIQP